MTNVLSTAVRPLHEAVADWHRYLADADDNDDLEMVKVLVGALEATARHLHAEGDVAVLNVVAHCAQACIDLAKELGEPVPGEEDDDAEAEAV